MSTGFPGDGHHGNWRDHGVLVISSQVILVPKLRLGNQD